MTKSIYDAVGLTPYRALLLHLLLIGFPLRFGLFPTGWGKAWLSIPDSIIPPPCQIFHANRECSETEEAVIRDFGARFISQYSLAWFVCIIMRTSTANTVAYHRILLALSVSQLIVMSWLQTFFHPTPTEQEFDPLFFTNLVFYTVMASAVSLWTITTHPYIPVGSMKWSIPANAIFCSGVFNIFLATASFQVLLRNDSQFYHHEKATPVITICFTLAAMQTAILSVLLLRIRYFLTMPQLRSVCLYRVILNVVLPWFWFPELSPSIPVDQRITVAVRVFSTLTYFIGFLWAGKAEGFSRILSSEKED